MYRGRLIPGDDPGVFISYEPDNRPVGEQARLSHRSKRIACILVADFAIAAIMRANPELRESPFALLRMPTSRSPGINSGRQSITYQPHSELSHVSPAARTAGLRPGMTVAQARALIPDLIVMRPSAAAEKSAADALLDVAESMSPVAEAGMP